jgi:transposase
MGGFALNADINGSLNIGRKIIPELSLGTIGDRSLAARPVRVNPLKAFAQEKSGSTKVVDASNRKSLLVDSGRF